MFPPHQDAQFMCICMHMPRLYMQSQTLWTQTTTALEIIHLLLIEMQICSTKQTPQQAAQSFTCIQPSPLVPFRDATYTEVCTCLFAYIRTCVCRNPCACECVHAHRCKCLCVFMWMCAGINVCMCVHVHVNARRYQCLCVHVCACACACVPIRACVCMRRYQCMHVHVNMHTHTYQCV